MTIQGIKTSTITICDFVDVVYNRATTSFDIDALFIWTNKKTHTHTQRKWYMILFTKRRIVYDTYDTRYHFLLFRCFCSHARFVCPPIWKFIFVEIGIVLMPAFSPHLLDQINRFIAHFIALNSQNKRKMSDVFISKFSQTGWEIYCCAKCSLCAVIRRLLHVLLKFSEK